MKVKLNVDRAGQTTTEKSVRELVYGKNGRPIRRGDGFKTQVVTKPVAHPFYQAAGDVIEVEDAEGLRMIAARQAVQVADDTPLSPNRDDPRIYRGPAHVA